MNVLVTGANGFVGTHLVAALRARGDRVEACGGPGTELGFEITDLAAVSARVEQAKPDAVIHLAGVSSVAQSHADPASTVAINALGTMNLLQAVRDHTPRARILLIGSGEEYGRLGAGERAREDRPLAPLSPYGASKVVVEVLARQSFEAYGTAVILSRPFNHLGAGQSPNFVMPSFAEQLVRITRGESAPIIQVGDLSPVRDFTHVLDVVDAYLLLIERGRPGEAYNVCSGQGLSVGDALATLQQMAGTEAQVRVDPARIRAVEIPWLVGDPGRIDALGWVRKRPLRQAFRDILDSAGGPSFVPSSASSSTR
jgi:GDP-4-dehydro-6-deoxy-D-mannose reductase